MESITYLKVSELYPNPKQPRKNFDEVAMKELAASIRSVGVLQPATVRQVKFKKGYEIVCGERRWRAATEAGLETIPCIIRVLTDEEAMDVAITENLQRKDIDPFEEAQAFQYLLDKGQAFDDIAALFGKSSIFVRGRVKLNELIEPLRKLYETKVIPVSHCLELCKLTPDIQTRIYNDRYQEKAHYYNSWRTSTLSAIRKGLDDYMQALKSAPFDKTECDTCPKNTAVCGLFEDMRDISCSDKECFKRKIIEHRVAKIIKKHEDNPDLILYAYYGGGDINDKVFARIKEEGIPYYTDKQFFIVPDKDNAAKIDSGEYRRAMRIDDMKFGAMEIVRSTGRNSAPSTPESAIVDIKMRDIRNEELRIEKTIEEVTKLYYDKKKEFPVKAPLSELEIALMYYCMTEYNEKERLLGRNKPVSDNIARIINMTEEERIVAVRAFLRKELPTSGNGPASEINIELYKQYFPEDAAAIEQKHRDTYERRKGKIDARIAEIKAAEKPTKKAKK